MAPDKMERFDLMERLQGVRQIWPQVNETTTVNIIEPNQKIARLEFSAEVDAHRWLDVSFRQDMNGFKAWLWRAAGALFNNHQWFNRGSYMGYQRTQTTSEDVEIRQYSRIRRYGRVLLRGGYSKAADTLFIAEYCEIYDRISFNPHTAALNYIDGVK